MNILTRILLVPLLLVALLVSNAVLADGGDEKARALLLGTTTSVENSGLLGPLLDAFREDTGIEVHAVVRGSGAILQLGRSGDFDVVLVHNPDAEKTFVADGHGVARHPVMTSRFMIVGPADDPADVRTASDAADALSRIADGPFAFISRGDQSGTNAAERNLWNIAGLSPWTDRARWYRETGSGMGATLNMASALSAYTFTESGSWNSFSNRGELEILFSNGTEMANPYSIIPISPERHAHIGAGAAARLLNWLTGPAGQSFIAGFQIDGTPPFTPVR